MKNFQSKLANALLVIVSCSVTFVCLEIAYRIFLKGQDAMQFSVHSNSVWDFDRDLGYSYRPQAHTDWATIRSGVPVLCGSFVSGLLGSPGKGLTSQQLAAGPRYIVLGDSFTAMVHDGETWPDILSDKIKQQTTEAVPILNLARDGYGVLQMFDQAAKLLRDGYRPTALIIAITAADLLRARMWRMTSEGTSSQDVFSSSVPSLEIKPTTHIRTTLIDGHVTRSWCERSRASGKENDTSKEIIQALLATKLQDERRGLKLVINVLSVTQCYICNRILHADPLHGIGRMTGHAYHNFNRFQDDPQFISDVLEIRKAGIPVWLVYLPVYPELRNARKQLDSQQQQLFESLAAEVNRVIDLTPNSPLEDSALPLTMMPYDSHPSHSGLAYYANQLFSQQKW